MSLAWSLYRGVAPAAGLIAPAVAVLAPRTERALWPERLGHVQAGPVDAWVHAASMGEASAVAALVRVLRDAAPGARLHLTSTTRTGRERLLGLGERASLAPLDTPQACAGFFERLRPKRLFIVETELWPHWLIRAHVLHVPVAVVSARLSDRSVSGYRRLGRPLRDLLGGLAGVMCQTDADRARWTRLGSPKDRTIVMGNLKNDALPCAVEDRSARKRALGFDPGRPLITLGSVRPGEVRLLAGAWRALPHALRDHWQVAVVPRHASATPGLQDEARKGGDGGDDTAPWRWNDRPGVLMSHYHASDVAFVGGSLKPYGGHNPLEPAAAGAVVLMGRHHGSQEGQLAILRSAGAVQIVSEFDIAEVLRRLFESDVERAALSGAALEAARGARGAGARAGERLRTWGLWPA